MKIQFRQGIVSTYSVGPNPQFLQASMTPGYVDFNVSPEPTVVAFAHGQSDYLETFTTDVTRAWGPLLSGVDNYLYWELDLITGLARFRITTLPPVYSLTPPPAVGDQHWFDLSTTTMKFWNGSKWVPKVAVFAGVALGGSVANLTTYTDGISQVGLNVPSDPGFIMLDHLLRPLRISNLEFLTTTSKVRIKTTSGTSGVLAVPPNAFVPVRASENIPAFSLVYFSGADSVGLASSNPALTVPRTPIGVVQEELSINEVGDVTQSGEIQSDSWDWTGHIGKPVYCDSVGQITTVRPNGLLVYRVGYIKNKNTILFQVDAETMPQIYQAAPNDIIVDGVAPISSAFSTNLIGERIWTVSIAEATDTQDGYMSATQVQSILDLDTRLTTAESDILNRALLSHTHPISAVIGLQGALDAKSDVGHNHDTMYSQLGHNHDLEYSPLGHTHVISDVLSLQDALDGKAPTIHNHAITDVTGLQTALNAKSDVGHTHVISDVSGLVSALALKADVSHNHSLVSLTDVSVSSPADGEVLTYQAGTWVAAPAAPAVSGDYLFTFAVGIPGPGPISAHIHHAGMTAQQAFSLISGTTRNSPVADSGNQPFIVLTTDLNGEFGDEHTHDLTVFYDYDNYTFIVTNITNNLAYNHVAKLIGSWDANIKPAPFDTQPSSGIVDVGSAAHHNVHFRATDSSDVTFYVRTDSYWTGMQQYWEEGYNPTTPGPMPIGGTILFGKHDVGNVIFDPDVGVTINTPESLTITKLHGKATLTKVGPDEWDLEGNLEP